MQKIQIPNWVYRQIEINSIEINPQLSKVVLNDYGKASLQCFILHKYWTKAPKQQNVAKRCNWSIP
jgi:hypothetical protein